MTIIYVLFLVFACWCYGQSKKNAPAASKPMKRYWFDAKPRAKDEKPVRWHFGSKTK